MVSSNDQLAEYLTQCDEAVICDLIKLLKSRLCLSSLRLAKRCPSVESIPVSGSAARRELVDQIVNMLMWYGASSIVSTIKKIAGRPAGTPYSRIAMDTAKVIRSRLPKEQREKVDIPRTPSVSELETMITQMLIGASLHKKSIDKVTQILTEAGLDQDAAKAVARKYGTGIGGLSLAVLGKVLGKKTVTVIIEQVIINFSARVLGKEAARVLAKRLLFKFAQKTILSTLSFVGWAWFAGGALLFATSPARRVTLKVVPFIALLRTREECA